MPNGYDATMDFSAQFGGRDAAEAVLPLFRALKAAAKGIAIPGFPFLKLAFILRVDGSVNAYGLDGLGNLQVDGADYVSLDIGLPAGRYDGSDGETARCISAHLRAVPDYLQALDDPRLAQVPYDALGEAIDRIVAAFEKEAI